MEQSLSRTTAATFEDLALLFPESDMSPEQAAQPLEVTVSVDYRGPFNGRLVLRASQCVMPAIAANMLGEDESKQRPLQRDALGELANVVCGNVLPIVGGAEAIFHLSAPHVHAEGDALSRDEDVPKARVEFGVEEGRIEAQLFVFTESVESNAALSAA
jgi:CheY-specific phosphatase CheX